MPVDFEQIDRLREARRTGLITAFESKGESGFSKVLHAIQTPLYITAGMVDEYLKRQKGFAPTSYGDILKESSANLIPWVSDYKRRITYSDIVDNKAAAFALNIVGDPITWIPATRFIKAGKLLHAGTKLLVGKPTRLAINSVDKMLGSRVGQNMDDLSLAVKRAFISDYDLKRLGGKELMKLKRKYYAKVESEAGKLALSVRNGLEKLVPDARRREHLFDLVERRPVVDMTLPGEQISGHLKALRANNDFVSWQNKLKSLTAKEREGYNFAVDAQNNLERMKIEAGLLTRGRALGMVKKTGLNYLPHMYGRKSHVLERLDDAIGKLRKGGKDADEIKALVGENPDKILKELTNYRKELEGMGEMMDPSIIEKLKASVPWTKRRELIDPAAEKKLLGLNINMDLAQVLGVESAQVAKAVASARHVQALVNYMTRKKLLFDKIPTGDELVEQLGKTKASGLSGRFVSADDWKISALKGKYIPEEIAQDIRRATEMYKNPKFIEGFLEKFRGVQNVWKAWTLAVFPTYHSRNAISNVWNNFLAGMGTTSIPHYKTSTQLLWKWKMGTLSKMEKEIVEKAIDLRVLRSGLFGDEIGEIMGKKLDRLTRLGKGAAYTVHPAYNPVVNLGFKTGSAIENHARLAHFLWARGKGLADDDAADSVMKYLFDYKYGITPFEKKMFRDFSMPFYTWTRFNMPLQLEMLATKPGRFLTLPKGMTALEDIGGSQDGPKPNEYFMADWMKRATKIRLRWNKDKEAYEYFMLDNWIPSADMIKLLDQGAFRDMLTGLVSPFVKLPIEVAFNYNLFQKKKIKRYKGEKKKLLGFSVDPRWFDHPARSIRLINEADKTMDAFFNKTGQTSKAEAIARVWVGKIYPYRPEKQKKWWEYQLGRRVSELKSIRRYAEKREWADQVGILDGLVDEMETEKKYFQGLDTAQFR